MQPEKRLEKLISKRRFDEAEAFAKQFGLDLQVGNIDIFIFMNFGKEIAIFLTHSDRRIASLTLIRNIMR